MNLEDIKSYKDACKIINRKPRRYRDNHINIYEQLSTITAAVNYIETGTQWKHIVKPNNEFYEIYYWKTFSTYSNDKSDKGLFSLHSDHGLVLPVLVSVLIYDLQQHVVQNMLKQLLKYYYVSGLILILLNSRGQHQLSSLYV